MLPFHQMGRFKWHKLGLEYTLEDAQPPAVGVVEQVCGLFRDAGLDVY